MDWKIFFVVLGGLVSLFTIGLMIYDAGQAAAYKELASKYREDCRELITKLAQAVKQ